MMRVTLLAVVAAGTLVGYASPTAFTETTLHAKPAFSTPGHAVDGVPAMKRQEEFALVVTYEMPVDPERMDDFMSWIEDGIAGSREAPGNLRFDVFLDRDRPGYVMFVERWASAEEQERYMSWREERGELEQMISYMVGPIVKRTWRLSASLQGGG